MIPAPLTIAIGGDHAGLPLKSALQEALAAAGHAVLDFGTNATASVDYPDFAHQVCGRGGGRPARPSACWSAAPGSACQIAANRHAGIRATVLHSTTEARLTRAHNDANIACFGARTHRAGSGAGCAGRLPGHRIRGRPARPPPRQACLPSA